MSRTPLRRAVLAFPPLSSPTYAPLGLAALVGFLRRYLPGCDVVARDLNIEAWHGAALAEEERALVRYFQGLGPDDFFDVAVYARRLEQWRAVGQRLARLLLADARIYVERGEAGEELRACLDRLLRPLLAGDPELVGLSVVFPQQLIPALALARRLREPETGRRPMVVLGGAALSSLRVEELLGACADVVDAVAVGEGEVTTMWLCAGEPLEHIPGLVRLTPGEGAVRISRPAAIPIDLLPPPDFSDLDLRRYLNPEPVLPFLLSRGCRWSRCRFCAHNASWGRYRRLEPATAAEHLARHDARHFFSADQYVEAGDLVGLAGALEGLQLRPAGLHVFGRPLPSYSAEALERAAAAGVRWISWGVESGSQRLLDLARKGIEVEVVRRVLRDAARAGISNMMMLIHGLPGGTDEDLEATFRLVEDVYPHLDALTASRFVLFANTDFGRRPERYGLRGWKKTRSRAGPSQGARNTTGQRLLARNVPLPAPGSGGARLRRRQALGQATLDGEGGPE